MWMTHIQMQLIKNYMKKCNIPSSLKKICLNIKLKFDASWEKKWDVYG